VLIATATQKRR